MNGCLDRFRSLESDCSLLLNLEEGRSPAVSFWDLIAMAFLVNSLQIIQLFSGACSSVRLASGSHQGLSRFVQSAGNSVSYT